MEYIKNPKMIESNSFDIIQGIIDDIRPGYQFKNEIEEKIIKRCIHTSADFEYLDILKISNTSVESIINALNNKCTIYTDTNMALSGINKTKLKALGCDYKCLVADEKTAKLAKEKEITRSMAAIEIAMQEEGEKLFVFGNAPTALYKTIEMVNEGCDVDAIIGAPVGFVGASDSKYELEKTSIPHIVVQGRKGGSNIAAAIMNAILYAM